jgi:hypothetical protein
MLPSCPKDVSAVPKQWNGFGNCWEVGFCMLRAELFNRKCYTTHIKLNKLHGLSPRASCTDRASAACRRSDCQLVRREGSTWSAWRIPPAVFLGFLDRSRYFCVGISINKIISVAEYLHEVSTEKASTLSGLKPFRRTNSASACNIFNLLRSKHLKAQLDVC